jgi:hypothetical protein
VAELELLDEEPVMEIDLAHERRRLASAFEDEQLLSTGIGRRFRELLVRQVPTAIIADLIAFNFLEDMDLKQSLLADCDVRRRVCRTVDAFKSLHSLLPATSPVDYCKNPSLN